MSFQNIANQAIGQVAGAMTAGKVVDQQKEGLKKQQEALTGEQRAEQLQKAQLTLSGYQQALKEQQAIGKEYKEAHEAANKAFMENERAKQVLDIAEQDKAIINKKYDKAAQEALASGNQHKFWSIAGKTMGELATKYDPYVKAQRAAESAYNEAKTRFASVSEQRDVIEKRMQILRGQKEQAYSTIEKLYDGGNK